MDIYVAESRKELGHRAAHDIAAALRALLREQRNVRMILAAAPSQSEMLAALRTDPDIDWTRIIAFHMDEYIRLPTNAPQGFANWLKREFADHVPLARFVPIDPGDDPERACQEYAAQLAEAPIDVVLLGIGTNGHLAFNDPPADLLDPLAVKVVVLDQMCREQQVLDGCFAGFDEVPRTAITLTIPTLLSGREVFCCVPGKHKSAAVKAALEAPISGACPATALRTHPRCHLYVDREAMSQSEEHARS